MECVVRGYLAGSGLKEYQANGFVCGVALPAGLRLADRLPEPIFTPATKAEEGHDENISFEQMAEIVGGELASRLRTLSLALYQRGCELAGARGILLADTKFEFGILPDGGLILIDEALTPDSSRYWLADPWSHWASVVLGTPMTNRWRVARLWATRVCRSAKVTASISEGWAR